MTTRSRLGLFEGYGVELEYAIVDFKSYDIKTISDELLRKITGRWSNDAELGPVGLSNEFARHVLEMCNIKPVPGLSGLAAVFQDAVDEVNQLLEPMGARLMPTGMHPWMEPARETRLWNHRLRKIYRTYDRVFNCSRHGWANVQSSQINVSFSGDSEFERLHTAVRFLLPLLPALAASSPIVERRVTGAMDNRMYYYRENQRNVPSITGRVVPELIRTRDEYERHILEVMYRDITPLDPKGVLQDEWLNSRGAIARFTRSAIEIRVLDVQECPAADMAVAEAVVTALKALTEGRWSDPENLARLDTERLASILDDTIREGECAVIKDCDYLKYLGLHEKGATAGEVWRHLVETLINPDNIDRQVLDALGKILEQGTLARRILAATGENPSKEKLSDVYGRLCECLKKGEVFTG